MIQQSAAPYLHSVNSIAHHVWSQNETVYACIQNHKMAFYATDTSCSMFRAQHLLVNSCEETMNQEHFVRKKKMVLSLPHSFVFSYLPASIRVLLIIQARKEGEWVLKYAFGLFLAKLYGYCLSVAYIVRPDHSYIQCLSTNNLIHSGLHSTLLSML